MSPILKIESLTVKDIRRVLEDVVEYDSDHLFLPEEPYIYPRISVPPWHGKWGDYFDTKDREKYIADTCKTLFRLAGDAETHVPQIDTLLSSLLEFRVYVRGVQPGSFEDDFARCAYDILVRLPFRPLRLPSAPPDIDKRYFWGDETSVRGSPAESIRSGTWESLRVATSLSAAIIQMTLCIVIPGPNAFRHTVPGYPNIIAELLETCSDFASQCVSSAEHQQWFIIRAALWSSWQRSVMLYHYANLRDALLSERGLQGWHRLKINDLRSTKPNPGLSIHDMSRLYAAQGKARSMCSWAFELLRTETVCLGADFRTFHQRYSQLWSHASARCKKGSQMPCAGKDPDGCWRFKGMVVKDQSAHNFGCERPCRKLRWDESSYRSVSGSRAVMIAPARSWTRDTRLRYCSASESTLVISHVWSHGQGGRPHLGVNRCLHRRYVKIAEVLGCDSYWWDSACIPDDHTLRSEAIQNINSTFSRSKVTLVCDKDLMGIDISNLTLEIEETILATILVCDWNLRAWTFLESVRGRQNIHLLCKDDRVIPFLRVVRDIFDHGSIDLAILSFTIPHMFPGRNQTLPEEGDRFLYMTREESGQVLSYRPASRKGDDVIIWSLLADDDGCDSPEKLWQSRARKYDGEFVHTGFLMSSAPRLQTKGLSWAPSTPYYKPLRENPSTQVSSFRAFISPETWPGEITDKGLLAAWHVYEFDITDIVKSNVHVSGITDDQIAILTQLCDLHLQDSRWGALLRPMSNFRTFGRGEDTSTKYRGLVRGTLMAVLGSNSVSKPSQKPAEDRGWRWKGTYEWDEKVRLPTFVEEYDFLIE